MKTAIIFLADGLEECEALNVIDLLRRTKEIQVITASISGKKEISSAHDITFMADELAENIDFSKADMVILPGGMPGTKYLSESEIVKKQVVEFSKDKYVAAICAAPSVLGMLGVLDGVKATCYPSFETKLGKANPIDKGVVKDGNIITGRALGSAIPFALEIIRTLLGNDKAKDVADEICFEAEY